jgi:hypothetical protein
MEMDADYGGTVESSRQGEGLTEAPIPASARDQDAFASDPFAQLFAESELIDLY